MLDTVVTRPVALYALTYGIDTKANGSLDSVTTTAPHPFYVQGENAFVAAADLKLGDDFLLASGLRAELVDIEVEQAAAGSTCTTFGRRRQCVHRFHPSALTGTG